MNNVQLAKIINNEPDLVVFNNPNNLIIILARHKSHGAWRGYVGCHLGGPEHLFKAINREDDYEVHGGITFQGEHCDFEGMYPGYRYVGFDCAHVGDILPALGLLNEGDIYRSFEYARDEAFKLYDQVIAKAESLKEKIPTENKQEKISDEWIRLQRRENITSNEIRQEAEAFSKKHKLSRLETIEKRQELLYDNKIASEAVWKQLKVAGRLERELQDKWLAIRKIIKQRKADNYSQ